MKSDSKSILQDLGKKKAEGFDYLVKITAVDYTDHIDAIYVVRNMDASKDEIIEVTLPAKDPSLPTAINIHPSADWYERELSEMFGITIKGRITPRLLLEKWDGADPPLRKSFAWDAQYRTSDDKK